MRHGGPIILPVKHRDDPQQEHDGRKPASALPPGATAQEAATTIDIGDVKRTEAKLHQDEQELRRIIDLIPQIIVVLNPDGTVIYANRGTPEYTGTSPDEMSADEDTLDRVFHPEDVQRLREE